MQEVTLIQMLDARERRVWAQQELLARYGKPIVCFTMNIPGPVKDTPLIRRSFEYGWRMLEHRLPKILHREITMEVTGCQALYAVDMPALAVKRICVGIEDSFPMGRLYDMDVLDAQGSKLDREAVDGKSRDCIVCGAAGRGCASRRLHSVPELQAAANGLMERHFAQLDSERIGSLAVKALLEEVCTTPKPGLVDCRNSGSHRDMNLATFLASASALAPYFTNCVRIGQNTAGSPPETTFPQLRDAGWTAEQRMLEATGGVNTHKGAVFTMGLLCGAAGRLWNPAEGFRAERLLEEVSTMTACFMAADRASSAQTTAGERLYAASGVQGVRGEAAKGFPSLRDVGLPVYRQFADLGRNDAGVKTLLALITRVEDTNLLHRGGAAKAAEAVERTRQVETVAQAEALDDWFISENLSPGGCADLLAAVYFLTDLESFH